MRLESTTLREISQTQKGWQFRIPLLEELGVLQFRGTEGRTEVTGAAGRTGELLCHGTEFLFGMRQSSGVAGGDGTTGDVLNYPLSCTLKNGNRETFCYAYLPPGGKGWRT